MSDSGSSTSGSPGPDIPNPPFRHQLFKLKELPDPPASWRLAGKTPAVAVRDYILRKAQVDSMIDYHFWGIDPGVEKRLNITNKVKLLYKLLYHQAPEHRPRHMGEMVPGNMDAGPRLLSRSITGPRPLPVSRFYPDLPDTNKPLYPNYERPADAPPEMSDHWLQQQLLSARKRPDAPGQNVATQVAARSAKRRTIRKNPPAYNVKDVIDAVEKTVFQFAYFDLERHSTAAPLTPRPHISATREEDLFKAVVGSSPAVSSVSMDFDPTVDTWKFGNGGKPYIYRGRGPVGRMNSGAVDCAIVVGRLLDAGSTVIDRKEPGWPASFTNAERAFIEATDLNWDVCSPEVSVDQRDQLWYVLGQAEPNIGVGNVNPFWTVWSTSTANFAQFQFQYSESSSNCLCSARGITTEECDSAFVAATLSHDEAPGVEMEELVSRFFAPTRKEDCAVCHRQQTVSRAKRFSNLPMRMVVLCSDPQVRGHTSDLSFTFANSEGKECNAKYRWLGGVYYKNSHFRVVWTDAKRGEVDTGSIRYYDGADNCGLILGGIPPAHPQERVPGGWMGEGVIPMLVYERVMDPDSGVLNLARQSIKDMLGAQTQQKFILDAHAPWNLPLQPPGLSTQPWERILSEHGQRFHTSAVAHFPGEPVNRSPRNTYPELFRQDHPTPQMTRGYLPDPTLPQMVSPSDRLNQDFPRLRSRTPSSFHALSPFPSTRGSVMQVDSDTQSNPGLVTLSPSASPAWMRAICAKRPHRPNEEAEAAEWYDTGRKKRKTVRFERTAKSSRNDRGPRRSPRLSEVVNA